jgi:hypothetical protein
MRVVLLLCLMTTTLGQARALAQPAPDVGEVSAQPGSEPISARPADGTLVVTARTQGGVAIDHGTVIVDEEPRGTLDGGTLTVIGIAEGRHTVAIEAGGFRRFEQNVTIRGSDQASLDARLVDTVAPSSPSHRTAWKVSLAASGGVAVAGVVFTAYSLGKMDSQLAQGEIQVLGNFGGSIGSDDCGKSYQQVLDVHGAGVTSFNYAALERACTWRTRSFFGIAATGVGVVGALVSLIMLTRETGPAQPPATATRAKQPAVAIVPIVTPGGGGASFSLRW